MIIHSPFAALDELGIINFDVVFLAFPQLPEDSELSFTEVAKPFWRVRLKILFNHAFAAGEILVFQ